MEARAEVSASLATTHEGCQFRFLGLPWSAWSFAFRTWIAMMAALYVAFWLLLESPSAVDRP